MTNKYKPQPTLGSYIWIIAIILLNGLFLYRYILEGRFLATILFVLVIVLVWYFAFGYPTFEIDSDRLLYRSINGKGAIAISSIRKIEEDATSYGKTILKPYRKGLRIQYDRFEDIFVNPRNEEDFIKNLLNINPNIEVTRTS